MKIRETYVVQFQYQDENWGDFSKLDKRSRAVLAEFTDIRAAKRFLLKQSREFSAVLCRLIKRTYSFPAKDEELYKVRKGIQI